jgi:hypothetical protein
MCIHQYQCGDVAWHSPTIKVRGFLIQRLTFKCCVLSAILRLFNRRILPINENTYLEFGYALPYLTILKIVCFDWFKAY